MNKNDKKPKKFTGKAEENGQSRKEKTEWDKAV